MRFILSLFLPWMSFLTMMRPLSAIVALMLQMTGIGWPIASIWAVYSLSRFKAKQDLERALAARDASRA